MLIKLPTAMNAEHACWTCRSRRIRCGFERPACAQCVSRGHTCPGYSRRRLIRFRRHRGVQDAEHFSTRHANRHSPDRTQSLSFLLHDLHLGYEYLIQAAIYANDIRASWYRNSYLAGNAFDCRTDTLSNVVSAARHVIVVRAISHHVLTAKPTSLSLDLSGLMTRAHDHMGRAMRAVLNDLERDNSGQMHSTSENLAADILKLGLAELFLSTKPTWLPHFKTFRHIVDRMGGLQQALWKQKLGQRDVIVYLMTIVTANTTSPASCQNVVTRDQAHLKWFCDQQQAADYPAFPCPSPLFRIIVRINDLRVQMRSLEGSNESKIEPLKAILPDIQDFSPSVWLTTMSKPHRILWRKIATVYHLAVRIYAVGALKQLDNSKRASRIAMEKLTQNDRTLMLQTIEDMPRDVLVRYSLVWPVVIAGVYASTVADRAAITAILLDLSRTCGIMTPLYANDVLSRFWSAEVGGWEDCFDQAYCFLA